jgi:hypothetical protein
MASWLSHTPAQQENAGSRASEQDGDVVADLTGARRRCRAASMIGEVGHASERFFEVVGALGHAEEERGRPVRSGDGELVTEIQAEAAASVPADSEAGGVNKTQGGGGPFVLTWLEDGRDITDGSTRTGGKGQLSAVQTAARAPATAALREGYAERRLSVRHYPG